MALTENNVQNGQQNEQKRKKTRSEPKTTEPEPEQKTKNTDEGREVSNNIIGFQVQDGIKVNLKNGELVIRAKLRTPPTISSTGKSLLLASSGGVIQTPIIVQGRAVAIGFNVMIKRTKKEIDADKEYDGE